MIHAIHSIPSKPYFVIAVIHSPLYVSCVVCTAPGMFLPVAGNPCFYIECVVVAEPWQDVNGFIPLTEVIRQCGSGSGLPANFQQGFMNPCTQQLPQCSE